MSSEISEWLPARIFKYGTLTLAGATAIGSLVGFLVSNETPSISGFIEALESTDQNSIDAKTVAYRLIPIAAILAASYPFARVFSNVLVNTVGPLLEPKGLESKKETEPKAA